MKKFIGILLVLAMLTVSAAAWADIKQGPTTRTRDIVLFADEGETDPLAAGDDTAGDDFAALGAASVQEMVKYDFPSSLASAKENDLYNIGEELSFTFKAEEDSYLTILDFTPSGQIVVLYPNQWVEDNFVKAGQEVRIPAEGQKFAMKTGGPAGVDVVKAIAANKDIPILDVENQQLAGPFAVLQDPKEGTRDILLMAAEEPETDPAADPLRWSAASLAVMTQAEDKAQPSGFTVAGSAGESVKMWANKTKFLTGNTVLVKFLSDKAAKLVSLVNIGASSAENNLLPEGTEVTLQPGEILVLPRKDDKWKLVASGAAGKDIVTGKLAFDDGTEMELSFEVLVEESE